ncbi:hypothetical protein LYNGBM3L_75840 [Moorena producens 3L]|uniref:Uncharacterized protein n=1 Tax=Moorena producens 3L TaxID=489825 RepID=F4XRF7_9CYAN|nr:hypothetical protein LYNGBM3L_75840 [Moorena producens 3L]OLT65295.1 hypothetical protein BI334_09810 [Moorena producens 3L]
MGLYGLNRSMELWSDLATDLMNLKPHKHLNFIKGIKALSLIQSIIQSIFLVAVFSPLKGTSKEWEPLKEYGLGVECYSGFQDSLLQVIVEPNSKSIQFCIPST